MSISWTPEELEAMRLADAEIEAEFDDGSYYISDLEHRALDAELDELAQIEDLSRKERVLRDRRRAYKKAYNSAHKEERRAYNQEYRQKHTPEVMAYRVQYYLDNREWIIQARHRYYQENREKVLAKCADYYRAHQAERQACHKAYAASHSREIKAYKAKWQKVEQALQRLQKVDGGRKGGD